MHPGPMNRGVEIDSVGRRRRAVADPRAGRDGRRRAHGGARSAVAEFAECVTHRTPMLPLREPHPLSTDSSPPHRCLANDRRESAARSCSPTPGSSIRRAISISRRPADRRRRDPRGQARHRRGRRAGRHRGRRLPRPGRRARPDRHARLHRRAGRRDTARPSPPPARPPPPAASPPSSASPTPTPAIDDPAIVDFVLRRARDTGIVHVHPMAALTKGLKGKEMTEIGLLKAAGAVAFTDGAQERHQRAGDAPRADLRRAISTR